MTGIRRDGGLTAPQGTSPTAGIGLSHEKVASGKTSSTKTASSLAPVRAVERAIHLLQAFRPEVPRLPLSELARSTGLDKGTTRRLLHTLMACGLVDHDARTQRYALGVGLLTLANAVDKGREVRELAAPILTELAEKTGATSFLFVPHEGQALCVERVRAAMPGFEATWFLVGALTPLNCGGAPRCILAWLPEEERERALALPLPKRTPTVQTDPDELRRELPRIRAQGYESASDDFYIGITGTGVPIFDRNGVLVGAVSISSLTSMIAPQGRPLYLDELRAAAAEIGRLVMPK
jgi:DNA-binding IclR family transcriptional regulator